MEAKISIEHFAIVSFISLKPKLVSIRTKYKMPRGTFLSDDEKAKIDSFINEGVTPCEISTRLKLNRSRCVVYNYIKLGPNCGINRHHSRKPPLPECTLRHIWRLGSSEYSSSAQIRAQLALKRSARTVQNILHNCPYLRYGKRKRIELLTDVQKSRRLEFAMKLMSWVNEWKFVIFSVIYILETNSVFRTTALPAPDA